MIFCLLAAALSAGPTIPQSPPQPNPAIVDELRAYVHAHPSTPEEYVVSKFRDHDVVILGEYHRVDHMVLMVQRLIPLLYRAGIRTLAIEFARRVDQPEIDSLLSAPAYDEARARTIVFRHNPLWGYQEYVDLFKVAWTVNHSLPKDAPRFRILGLMNSPDFSLVKEPQDRDSGPIMTKVWHGETEKDWADALLKEVVNRGGKALVHCGVPHSFTRYRQPIVVDGRFVRFGDVRMGNYVDQAIGARAFGICLHQPWTNAKGYGAPMVLPADGYIDAALCRLAGDERRIGFDVVGSPFATLPGDQSLYKFGYENFNLGAMCDGYIYDRPFDRFEGVTPIHGFVNPGNLAAARAQSAEPSMRNATVETIDATIAQAADLRTQLPKEPRCPE